MAKISKTFNLDKTQYELDFVDIDPDRDFPVYLNPFTFSARSDRFSVDASRTIMGFFQHNLNLIRNNLVDQARLNFSHLNEPNETCLGMSRFRPRGRGMGDENSDDLFESILSSKAISSGLVDHLENTAIFIPGIGRDKVSDMTTNIIRSHLIEYTKSQCELLGIPLRSGVSSGFFWNPARMTWDQELTDMLVMNQRRILLVPKAVVSYVKEFTHSKYHQHFALEFLQEDHLSRNTSLVQTRYNRDGSIRRRFVTKKDLVRDELTADKELLLEFTKKHPAVFEGFRKEMAKKVSALENSEFDGNVIVNELIDYLVGKLTAVQKGPESASTYHNLMIGILEFIFYPNLINPIKELEINEGRKRIDISFDNGVQDTGFFYRLQHIHAIPCPYIFVECKNYTGDIRNPELDQMVGRLGPNKGKFGIIICRSLVDENSFLKRCHDSFVDNHGLIIPLTDKDIIAILMKKKEGVLHYEEELLTEKTRKIIMG